MRPPQSHTRSLLLPSHSESGGGPELFMYTVQFPVLHEAAEQSLSDSGRAGVAVTEIDADHSGEVDFDEFYG